MNPQGRRAFSTALLLCLACGGGSDLATAQELAIPAVVYPRLPKRAASVGGFVPQGWEIEAQASGDLNRDGIEDLAFVLRQGDPKNVLENTGLGENPFDTNPRILAVAFRGGPAGDYVLELENHTLIPRREDPVQVDPFGDGNGGIAVERGVLAVTLHLFMTAGGWDMFTATHKFQYRNGRFELIGFDRFDTHRASGGTMDISANYLTRRMRTAVGHLSGDVPTRVTWRALPRRAPLTLDAISDGLTFDPGP